MSSGREKIVRPSKLDVSDNPSGKLVREFAPSCEVSAGDDVAMLRTHAHGYRVRIGAYV